MIKTFKYKEVELTVKTNMLKDRKCYFGVKDIPASLEKAYRDNSYEKSDATPEIMLIDIYKSLAKAGIKPNSLKTGDLIYIGGTMTELGKQKTLEE